MRSPLVYLTVTKLKNQLLAVVKSPAKLAYAILLVALFAFTAFSGSAYDVEEMRNPQELVAIMTLFYTMMFLMVFASGSSSSNSPMFTLSDVTLLFPAPLSSNKILVYGLVRQLGLNVRIIGLDLKDDVIRFCEQVARDLGYDGLSFLTGDIQSYVSGEPIDMVVTLHACDVATDAAIVQAIGWDCRILLTVPCCQHELFPKIKNDRMKVMLKHGIIKERFSALLTDSIRGQLLEACGYDVNIMEFISLEHTPKNILIKAVRNGRPDRQKYQEYLAFAKDWQIRPYLEEELVRIGRIPERQD